MTYFVTSSFVNLFSLIRKVLVCPFPVVDYVPAEFTRLFATFDRKRHEMVLKINVSCP